MHEEPEGRAMVTVADTGCGMDEETKWRVFEKFYQGDPSHATKGNGLGTALAKRAADVTGPRLVSKAKRAMGQRSQSRCLLPLRTKRSDAAFATIER